MEQRTWSEWFWLPEGYTWKKIDEEIGADYPDIIQYVKWTIFFGVLLLAFRNLILVPLLLRPFGRRVGVREKPYPHPPPNEELEILYKINRARPPRKMLVKTAAKIEWPERKVERWLRQKALSMQMTTLEKFCDQGWDAVFYSCFFIRGLFIIVPQPYFWNPMEAVENIPFQRTPSSIWWYCVFDCGFYVTQTIILFLRDRRHDFFVMLAHHFVTIASSLFCVMMNNLKTMSYLVFIHEIADIPLAIAKMCSYAKFSSFHGIIMVVFATLWVSTRLIAYPWMTSVSVLKYDPGAPWPAFFCFKILGFLTLFLHILWTKDLIQAIWVRLSTNKYADSRSSPEELSEDSEQEKSAPKAAFRRKNN